MEHNEQNEIKYTSRTEKYHGPAKKKKASVPDAGLSAQEAAQEEQPASPPEDTPEAVFDTEEGQLSFLPQEEAEQRTPKMQKPPRPAWFLWVRTIAIVIAVMIAAYFFAFEIAVVDGPSMEPTLQAGQRILVNKVSRYFEFPARGEVVVTRFPNYDGLYVKRLIAYPGEWVEIYDNQVYLNGEVLGEKYLPAGQEYEDMELTQVPEGCVFVLGDNRGFAFESRAQSIGCIDADLLVGTAYAVVWPFDQMHSIKS